MDQTTSRTIPEIELEALITVPGETERTLENRFFWHLQAYTVKARAPQTKLHIKCVARTCPPPRKIFSSFAGWENDQFKFLFKPRDAKEKSR